MEATKIAGMVLCVLWDRGRMQRNKLPSPATLATLSLSLEMQGEMEDGGTVWEETIS